MLLLKPVANLTCLLWFLTLSATATAVGRAQEATAYRKIVLVAGKTAKIDKLGHHDYLAGCKALEFFLKQTPGVEVVQVTEGWPSDESVWEGADTIVFYTDGGGKQEFLATPERLSRVQSMVDAGVGLVMLHQAVDYPDEIGAQAKSWLGGVYLTGPSARGHWDSKHVDFPDHPIARGVTPWEINDGWLNALVFVEQMRGITPLVWSGKEYAGSRAGLDGDIVGWAYDRPTKPSVHRPARSFAFTGLDAHAAWSLPGMRQLVVNGVLWTAGAAIPAEGAPCQIEEIALAELQTPRQRKPAP